MEELIDKLFEQNHAIIFEDIETYSRTGKVTGSFRKLLITMLEQFK